MFSFDQAKTVVAFLVLLVFVFVFFKIVISFQSSKSAKTLTIDLVNKIAELLLVRSITDNQPRDNKKLKKTKEPINVKKFEESNVHQGTAPAIKY